MIRPSIQFTVHGAAVPKGSMKAFIPKGWNRPVLTSTSKGLKAWESDIRKQLQAVMAETPPATVAALFDAPIAIGIRFHIVRPKSKKHAKYPVTRPDVDKLARAAIDALSTVLFRDDSQVVALQVRKVYAEDGAKAEFIIDSWG